VVWQGSAGDCRPYADQTPLTESTWTNRRQTGDRNTPSNIRLPNRPDGILPDLDVVPEKNQSLRGGLRDQHPVERVFVKVRQSSQS
jgi:hypothetical protein